MPLKTHICIYIYVYLAYVTSPESQIDLVSLILNLALILALILTLHLVELTLILALECGVFWVSPLTYSIM